MPKMKTKKSATKRYKTSATGIVKSTRAGKAHLNLCKSRKRKRNLRGTAVLCKPEQKRARRLLQA
jgi:large subunit ribosomal protein L35